MRLHLFSESPYCPETDLEAARAVASEWPIERAMSETLAHGERAKLSRRLPM